MKNKWLIIGLIVLIFGGLTFWAVSDSNKTKAEEQERDKEIAEQQSKKKLVKSIDSYITAAANAVNSMSYGPMYNTKKLFYIPVSNLEEDSCVYLDKGGEDPFGKWKEAYVVVHFDDESFIYDYYFTFEDSVGYYLPLTKSDEILPSGDNIIKDDKHDWSKGSGTSITTQVGETGVDEDEIVILKAGSCKV